MLAQRGSFHIHLLASILYVTLPRQSGHAVQVKVSAPLNNARIYEIEAQRLNEPEKLVQSIHWSHKISELVGCFIVFFINAINWSILFCQAIHLYEIKLMGIR